MPLHVLLYQLRYRKTIITGVMKGFDNTQTFDVQCSKMPRSSEVSWHCSTTAACRAKSLSDELQKRQGLSQQRHAGPHL